MRVSALPTTAAGAHQLHALAAAQDCVVSRQQARANGVQRWHIANEVAARRWQLAGRNAVVLHTGPRSRRQEWWCALFEVGRYAVLDGASAATAAGLVGYDTPEVHVSVPHGSRPHRPPGVRVHELISFHRDDVHPVAVPPRVRTPLAVVRGALWAPTTDRACAMLAAAVQQRLVPAHALRDPLDTAGPNRHRRQLLLALGDIEGGSHSLSEIDFFRVCRKFRLPPPDRQRVRHDGQGRRRYLDADWDDAALTAEVDGSAHMLVASWANDMDRQNEVTLGDRRVLRFSTMAVRLHEARVADQLGRGLRLGGLRW